MPPARLLFYTATVGALALVGRSLLIGPVPTWITLTVLAFNLLGDGIRDMLDPRLRGSV